MFSQFNFDRVLQNLVQIKQDVPIKVANATQRYFFNSWDQQGFNGETWATPKRKIEGTNEYKYPKLKDLGRHTRATLVKSGALRRAVGQSVREATFDRISLVVALPYAEAHNKGSEKKNIPQRQFIGHTEELQKRQIEIIQKGIDFIWQA